MEWEIIQDKGTFCIIQFTSKQGILKNFKDRIKLIIEEVSRDRVINRTREFGDDKEVCIAILYE